MPELKNIKKSLTDLYEGTVGSFKRAHAGAELMASQAAEDLALIPASGYVAEEIYKRWPEYTGQGLKQYGTEALEAAVTGYEEGMKQLPGGLGRIVIESSERAHEAWREAGGTGPEALAIAIATPGLPVSRAAKVAKRADLVDDALEGVRPMARGGARRAAAKPPRPGLTDWQSDVARSDMLAHYQPTVEAPEYMGQRRALKHEELRSMTAEDALEYARSGAHIKRRKDGSYIGGPQHVKSPADLIAMRQSIDRFIDAGAPGGNWYLRTRHGVRQITDGSPQEMQRHARELAVTSAGTELDPNFMAAVKIRNRVEAGADPKGATAARHRQFLGEQQGVPSELGPKTSQFAHQTDPTSPPTVTGTNDFRMARVFGYTAPDGSPWSAGLSEAQHAFMDSETILAVERANARGLGGRTDWQAEEIQAMAWVRQKADDLKSRNAELTDEEALERAAKAFPDFYDKMTYYSTHAATPGGDTGHLPGPNVDELSRETFAEPRGWADDHGHDILLHDSGLKLQQPARPGVGMWKGEAEPLEVSRPLVGHETGKPRRMDPVNRATLEKAEAFRAVVDAQEAAGGHFTMLEGLPGVRQKDLTGVELQHGRDLTTREMQDLERAVAPFQEGESAFLANTGPRTALHMDVAGVTKAQEAKVRAAIEAAGVPLETIKRARHESIYIPFDWASKEDGAVTKRLLEILDGPEAPNVRSYIDGSDRIRAEVLRRAELDAAEAKKTLPGYVVNEQVQNFRRIFAEKGFKGLEDALKKGTLLPAIFLPAIGVGVGSGLQEQERGT